MRRRDCLAAFGGVFTGLSGCLASRSSSGGASMPTRTVSLVAIDEEPRAYGIDVSVEVIEPEITAEHTATVSVSFENRGDTESPQLGLGKLYELSPVTEEYSHSAPDEVLLYGTDIPWRQPTRSDSCWATEQAGGPGDGGAGEPPTTLDPGATLTREYRVWDSRPETSCLPTGEYRYGFRDTQETPPFAWMFTIAVDSPN
jgi:hypothetical protein